jgi:hypothetical protein
MKLIGTHIAFLLLIAQSHGQISISSSAVSGFSSASQGDLYLDDNGVYYIGLETGALKEIGIVTKQGTQDGQILKWDTSNLIWQAQSPSNGDLVLERDTFYYKRTARLKFLNLNGLPGTANTLEPDLFLFNEISASLSSNAITGLEGELRFEVQVNFGSVTDRTNFNLRLDVNGSVFKRVYGAAYARNLDGHNNTSSRYFFEVENVNTADEFEFVLEQEANTGTNTDVQSDYFINSEVQIYAYDNTPVLTSIAASPELTLVQGPTGPAGIQGLQGPQGPTIGSPLDVYHASGKVSSSGAGLYMQGAAVTRQSTGTYQISFSSAHPNGADYPIVFSLEQNADEDDFVPAYSSVTANGFTVEVGRQDNGGSGGIPEDIGFSFNVPL